MAGTIQAGDANLWASRCAGQLARNLASGEQEGYGDRAGRPRFGHHISDQGGKKEALCDLASVTSRENPTDVVQHEMMLIGFGKRRAVFADVRGVIDSFFD
jgi:hypothetical protein